MWFSIFITLHALRLTLVHGTFLPSVASEFSESSSQKASESSFQESCSSTAESFTQDAAAGLHEFESSATETASAATSSFQESSSSFVNQIENVGQKAYESSQSSSSSKTAAESFQESSMSNLENFTSGGGSFGQQELSVRASEAAESMRAASESSFNAVESSAGGIFGLNEYESSFSQASESQQKSSLNTMAESFTNNASAGMQKFKSNLSQASESLQESSSNIMERSMNCVSGLQGSESSQTSSKTSSSAAAVSSNYEQSSQSSLVTGASGFDYDMYVNAFDKCKFISDAERQCYLQWLATFSGDSLNYYDNILGYLDAEKALTEEILDYDLFQKEIISVHNMLTSNGMYDVSTDLSTKTAIFDKCKSKLRKASKGVSSGSALYKLLRYSATADTTTMPCTVGLLNSIIKSQETYFSKISSTSSSQSSNSARSTSGKCVDTTQYQSVLEAANIAETERLLYSNYLNELASSNERSFADMINLFNKNTQVITSDMILDFASLNQEIRSVYDVLVQEQFFAANADWLAKKAQLTELKSKLSDALSYLDKNSCLYNALQFCLEKDISYVPLFVGLSSHLLEQQSSYFSSTSSTTVSSSKSGCCC